MLDAPVFVRGCDGGRRLSRARRRATPLAAVGRAGGRLDRRFRGACAGSGGAQLVAQQQLEGQVKERTAELTRANEKLVREAAERERAEARVRHSEDNLRKLFEVSPVSLVLTSAEHQAA